MHHRRHISDAAAEAEGAPTAVPPAVADAAVYTAARVATHSPIALIATDADCRVVFANGAAIRFLDAPEHELPGRRICELLGLGGHDEVEHAQRCPVHRLFAGQERRREPREVVLRLRGAVRSVLLAVGPLGDAAQPDGAILSVAPLRRDGPLHDQRRRMVARLLHDLRTPLAGIGVAAELIEPGPANAPVPGSIVDALRAHHADLMRYVSELADYALLDVEERLPGPQQVPLDDVLEAVLWRLSPQIQRREQRLRVQNALTRPLLAAQHYLEQALMAVVFDISTYAAVGSVLDVQAAERNGCAAIVVDGRDGAVTADEVHTLTDPYLRVRPGEHVAGLMSLAATERTIEYYGGTLSVTTTATSLRITLSIPLAATA